MIIETKKLITLFSGLMVRTDLEFIFHSLSGEVESFEFEFNSLCVRATAAWMIAVEFKTEAEAFRVKEQLLHILPADWFGINLYPDVSRSIGLQKRLR